MVLVATAQALIAHGGVHPEATDDAAALERLFEAPEATLDTA